MTDHGLAGLWDKLLGTVKVKVVGPQKKMWTYPLLRLSRPCRLPTRVIFKTSFIFASAPLLFLRKHFFSNDVVAQFRTSSTQGLTVAIIPFAGFMAIMSFQWHHLNRLPSKMFYESPLILLCGSAVVSAIMGNVDDTISITITIVLVLTGMPSSATCSSRLSSPLTQSTLYRNDVLNSRSRRSTSTSLTIAT